jgi:hypothetical protein
MTDKRTYYQLIPEKVYNNLSVISDLLHPDIKGFSIDNLKEIISIIACHIQKSDGFAPLKIVFLKKLVPQADKYLSGLIDAGIVLREGQYIPGEVSYKYRFAPEYESKFKSVLLTNAKLIRRIESVHHELLKEASKSVRYYSEQTKYLKQLTIADDYSNFIESHYTSETDQYNSIMGSATRIINKDIFYSIDNTSGRFHSNITNMAKGLRPYLRIKGEPLVNIDIKNSQPYLSTILLTDPGKVSYLTNNPVFALLLQSLKVSLNQDVKNYITLVISGQLYEFLMSEFDKEGLTLSRTETKRQVLRILFARNRMPKEEINKKCRLIFKDRFPTVHRIFSKVRGHEKGDKFQNFKRFAILLQRIESYLMLDVILKRIYKELPGTIAVTVHDSIMTGILTNNVEAVRKIMIEELTFFIGFQPQIKIEGIKEEIREEEKREITIKQYDATTFVSYN